MRSASNVIVIMVDQLRAFELGCYGNQAVRTPHLDRLAAEGVRFELGITNNPVCTPARSCLLTGQYSRTCTGAVGNIADDPPCPRRRRLVDPTIADTLRGVGYQTALIGKWHIDPSPLSVGFDDAYYPLTVHRYHGQRFFDNDRLGPVIPGFAPEHELEQVDRFLASSRDRPFFLFYNISLPHEPLGPAELPARYGSMYDREALPLRRNVFHYGPVPVAPRRRVGVPVQTDSRPGTMAHDETWFKVYRTWDYFWRVAGAPCWNAAAECGYPDPTIGELPSDALPPGFDLRDLYALYYGATSCVDDLVGGLMDSLRRHGLGDDTLILFTSDHGDNLGSHQLFNKDCLYQESLRIPYLLWHPRQLAPRANTTQIATLIDVMPTLLDLSGVVIPRSVQGQSLSPVVRGACSVLDRNLAFIETPAAQFGRPTVGIRTPSHLYGAFTEGAPGALAEGWGLYDLAADPFEERTLLGSTAAGTLESGLRAQLSAWHTSTPWLEVAAGSGH